MDSIFRPSRFDRFLETADDWLRQVYAIINGEEAPKFEPASAKVIPLPVRRKIDRNE